MRKVLCYFFSVLVLVCAAMTIAAQDFSSLLEKMESPAKGQGLDWKLSRKELKENSCSYYWEANGGKGHVSVTSTGSRQEASAKLRNMMMRVPVGPKTKLTGLGDEAFLYQSPGQRGGMILFRKSNEFVHITGTSAPVLERLARSLADLISGK